MSDVVIIAIIVAVGQIIQTIITKNTNKKIEEVRHATNSMKDALVASALKEGKQIGKDKQIEVQNKIDNRGIK